MILVKVYVTLKNSVVDVQGETVKEAIHSMGYKGISDVRIGKYFEIKFDNGNDDLKKDIDSICDDLLANPNIESYRYEIVEDN